MKRRPLNTTAVQKRDVRYYNLRKDTIYDKDGTEVEHVEGELKALRKYHDDGNKKEKIDPHEKYVVDLIEEGTGDVLRLVVRDGGWAVKSLSKALTNANKGDALGIGFSYGKEAVFASVFKYDEDQEANNGWASISEACDRSFDYDKAWVSHPAFVESSGRTAGVSAEQSADDVDELDLEEVDF